MATRLARTHETGLVVAPPKLDCLGLDCYETMSGGGCYPSNHHLYFPHEVYEETELLKEFKDNKFNIVSLPRCIHTLYHRQVDYVVPPSTQVMEEFLQQAGILAELGVMTTDLMMQEKRLGSQYATKAWSRVENSPKGRAYFEYIREDRMLKVLRLARRAIDETTIVPIRQIVSPHVIGARALQPMLNLPIAA